MSESHHGPRRGRYRYILFASTPALLLIAALIASLPIKGAHLRRPTSSGVATTAQPTSQGQMPSLDAATAWINSRPLRLADLRGKVVLVQFWTYTCINWRRQLPYVRAWADKYKDKGLVVIGVHSPEFAFERDLGNVKRAVSEIPVQYAVAADSDHEIWRAFDNHYWPALYFIDKNGRIRHQQFGEGKYAESEQVIKQLLAEAGASGLDTGVVSVSAVGPEAAADWESLRSPENYTGYVQTENFASPGGLVRDKRTAYATPEHLALNHWALTGDWTIKNDASESNDTNGKLTYRFHARDLHVVMGPSARGRRIRFRVLIDGHPPGAAHGTDIDEQGYGTMSAERMYHLVRQSKPIGDREFTIHFLDAGADVYCFTFG